MTHQSTLSAGRPDEMLYASDYRNRFDGITSPPQTRLRLARREYQPARSRLLGASTRVQSPSLTSHSPPFPVIDWHRVDKARTIRRSQRLTTSNSRKNDCRVRGERQNIMLLETRTPSSTGRRETSAPPFAKAFAHEGARRASFAGRNLLRPQTACRRKKSALPASRGKTPTSTS